MRKELYIILILLVVLQFITSCKQNKPPQNDVNVINKTDDKTVNMPNRKESVFVFRDMVNSSSYDYYFAINKNALLMKAAKSFGHSTDDSETMYYLMENVPDELLSKGSLFFVHKGEVKPPFLPEEVYTTRVNIPQNADYVSDPVFFKRDNKSLNLWLAELNQYIIAHGNRIEKLPSWVSDDKRIFREIGERE